MVQHFSERQWQGRSPNRSRTFATRQQGHGLRKSVWLCTQCRAWNEGTKPAECIAPDCMSGTFYRCDSKVEGQRFARLWLMEEHGEILSLQHHPRFALLCPTPNHGAPTHVRTYEADSSYYYARDPNTLIVEDVKPKSKAALDPVFKIKRAWFEAQYGIQIRIVN